jgi:hypothetical protein
VERSADLTSKPVDGLRHVELGGGRTVGRLGNDQSFDFDASSSRLAHGDPMGRADLARERGIGCG